MDGHEIATLQTGGYWTISTNEGAAGYETTLTFKAGFTPGPEDEVCHYANGEWDCGADGYDPVMRMITRTGITEVNGGWAVRDNPGAGAEIYLPVVQANATPGGDTPAAEHMLYLPVLSNMEGETGASSPENQAETADDTTIEEQEIAPEAEDAAGEGEASAEDETPADPELPSDSEEDSAEEDSGEDVEASDHVEAEKIYLPQIGDSE